MTRRIELFRNLAVVAGIAWMAGTTGAAADPGCLLIVEPETGTVAEQGGDLCGKRFTPASSFKVALALMGYDSGELLDATNPRRPYKAEYKARRRSVMRDTSPQSWLANSVVWYSQVLTRDLGIERFRAYLDAFDYGNRDLSPVEGRDDPLVSAWLSASLKISPREQVAFLSRMLSGQLPVSGRARDKTLAIMPRRNGGKGLTIYGKTGTGFQENAEGSLNFGRQIGWYVGWAERKGKRFVFAKLLVEEKRHKGAAGFRARDSAVAELARILGSR